MQDCNNCERRHKGAIREEGCQVFKEEIRNCWAWTDDPLWLEKVNREVNKYKGILK